MAQIIFYILIIWMLFQAVILLQDVFKHRKDLGDSSWLINGVIGFIADFADTLGIGSFALTTLMLNATKQLKDDRLLPGILNVGHAIPVITEAIIFVTVIKVDVITLVSLVLAAIVGSFLGSKLVPKLSEKSIRKWIGWALVVTAILMFLRQTNMIAMLGEGNTATSLTGTKLVIGIIGNFIFGALMTFGVGLYAPCMAMVYMLGMTPLAAFPIMMCSCAGLQPVASFNFIREKAYDRKISLAITIGGIPGVIIASQFLINLDISVISYLVILVIIYTGIQYIIKGMSKNGNK
ncbi:sulfite exporter TauE/SafE family protein [Enterococcus sp. ALS3]|uniref:Probable membrane transporter protein n=1 Tax=Enterococcus alishanensis TaxID=1303817 RepID=A0ABS6TFL1_9ENTE|nr:TSUP family transporter [Enterococcus alishanensis]MBV7391715.1 sulfite exporter TauE/SafE family protein [Enterococcus alishanensis]